MSHPPLFQGIFTALVTPFDEDQVDWPRYLNLIEHQINQGVQGLVPVGTTGESATLSPSEHFQAVETCVRVAKGRVKVIAGAGSNETSFAISLCQHAKKVGADGALVVTPYYNRPSQEGLFAHYQAINNAAQLPIVVYNVPSRTGVDLATDTVLRLAQLPNIMGIKDATGQIERASLMRLSVPSDFALLSGDDPSLLGYLAHGGHGVISVTANLAPKAMSELYHHARANEYEKARSVQDRLILLHKALFSDSSPAPVKWGLEQLGFCARTVRLPLVDCHEQAKHLMLEAMKTAGLMS